MNNIIFAFLLLPMYAFSQDIPIEWQACAQSNECRVWHEDCGGIPYNSKFSREMDGKLTGNLNCKQLLPEWKFVAYCAQGKCIRKEIKK